MRRLQNKILDFLYAERSRWILWLPVFYGAGIGGYFLLPHEPSLLLVAGLNAVMLTLLAVALRYNRGALVAGVLALLALGVLAGVLRTQMVAAPVLHKPISFTVVTGVVEEVTPRPDNTRLVLSQVKMERLLPENTPHKVSISLRGHLPEDSVHLGDTISMRAGFFPPPLPSAPNGFQFNRHFYFQQIGANGYSFGHDVPEVLQKATGETGFFAWVQRQRAEVFRLFMSSMGAREAPVAAALTMGEQRAISEDVFNVMRDSGLAHVLSISGLHLALAAGIFFFGIRLLFAAIPPLALRFDSKKLAAIVALLGSFGYLLLSGWPVPAQRSYVMVALVLLAVLFDRQVTPIRSLALAAAGILLFLPESVLNPSFQLSFAATLALVAYYEHWRENRVFDPEAPRKSRWHYFWGYWWGIIITSVAATIATTPYILHHFEGFPIYSVLGNLLSLSIVSFWIMPVIVLILLLLPFGLAGWLFPVLEEGIAAMLNMAEWVSGLPHAVIYLPPLSTSALIACTLGGLWLGLWQSKLRHLGWLAVAAGMVTLCWYQPPDVFISADGSKIALRVAADEMVLQRGRVDGFQQRQWRRFAGGAEFVTFSQYRKNPEKLAFRCDDVACIHKWGEVNAAILLHREALWEECGEADMVVAPSWSIYGRAREECTATILDRRAIAASGGLTLTYLQNGQWRVNTVYDAIGDRPWSRVSQERFNAPR